MSFPHVLVTGSSGMIGTRLCEFLEARGIPWTGLDIRTNPWSAAIDKRTLKMDVRNIEECVSVIPDDVGLIVHLAAHSRVLDIIKDPSKGVDNCQTVYSALEIARRKEIKKVIFSSSREVYGDDGRTPHMEAEAMVGTCENTYAASKLAGEAFCWAYYRTFGIDCTVLRFSNVYGRYDMTDRIIPLLIRKCLRNEDIHIFGKGKVLDFVYIDDLVDGIMRSIEQFDTSKNMAYNMASQVGTSLVNLAELIRTTTHSSSSISIEKNRRGEVMTCVIDITRAREVLGYSAKTVLAEGVAKSVEWYTPYVLAASK